MSAPRSPRNRLARASTSDLTIVVDTREQRPLIFSPSVRVVRAALPAGDYAPLGHEHRAAIERKSLADFVGCCTHARPRFFRELERLRGYDFCAVVVEAAFADVMRHRYRSTASPQAILATSHAIVTDFRIAVVWAGSRELAADSVEWMLHRFVRRLSTEQRSL